MTCKEQTQEKQRKQEKKMDTRSMDHHERRKLAPVDQQFPFFYETHSWLAMFIVLAPVFYFGIINPPFINEDNLNEKKLSKIILSILIYEFLIIGSMTFPAGPLIRPHPVFWRLIFGLALCYVFLLIVCLIAPASYTREHILKYFDQSLVQNLNYRYMHKIVH